MNKPTHPTDKELVEWNKLYAGSEPPKMPSMGLTLSREDLNQALGSGELKACPFCSDWAFSAGFQNPRTKIWVYKVTCTGCSVQIHYSSLDKNEARVRAIEKWNKRV